jgi:glycosyltransferase involved in cell wall biosynthesis
MAQQNSSRFWPDSKVGWQRPALKLAEKIMTKHDVKVILSSSPPISAHMIAMDLKKCFSVPWVADFRDLWESRRPEDIFSDPEMITKANRLLDDIQKKADLVTRVGDTILKDICPNAVTIRGGYDEDDFSFLPTMKPDKTFTLCHMGTVNDMVPIEPYFKAARTLAETYPEFEKEVRFKFIGVIDEEMIKGLGKQYNFSKQIEMTGYLPHGEALRAAASSSVLMLSIDSALPGILTGKILDYIAMPIPILACAARGGEIEKVIEQYRAGFCVDHGNTDVLTQHMKTLYEHHQAGQRWEKGNVSTFTRRESARMFAKIFDRIQHG